VTVYAFDVEFDVLVSLSAQSRGDAVAYAVVVRQRRRSAEVSAVVFGRAVWPAPVSPSSDLVAHA